MEQDELWSGVELRGGADSIGVSLHEKLDSLRGLIQDTDFLEGRGLSNEVNIRIFCYHPAKEMTVRHFVEQLKADSSLTCRLVERNLYQVFLSVCDDFDITEAIPDMEETDGGAYLLEQLLSTVGTNELIEKMQYSPHERGDVLLLTGVGNVFPFMRVHILLEALQPHFPDIPILVLYPGSFNGSQLKLFNTLPPSNYYRAFNVI